MRLILATKFVVKEKLFHIGEENLEKSPPVCGHPTVPTYGDDDDDGGGEGRKEGRKQWGGNLTDSESKENKNEPCCLVTEERSDVALGTIKLKTLHSPPLHHWRRWRGDRERERAR